MNGILLIDKPADMTSRDVVNIVGKKLGMKKVGHTGTLDPLATGVLVICVGKATKLVNNLTALTKEYIAEVTLGLETDTLDITGNILKQVKVNVSKNDITRAISTLIGEYEQEVPLYSAVKVNGKKLYWYAKEGISVNLPKRMVSIYELELINEPIVVDNIIKFKIRCLVSKGTYIRSLIRDLACQLDTVGVMSSLVRTKQGSFSLEQCLSLDNISESSIMSISQVLDIPKVVVNQTLKKMIVNGRIIDNIYGSDEILFVDSKNRELAIYQVTNSNRLKPKIVFGGIQ